MKTGNNSEYISYITNYSTYNHNNNKVVYKYYKYDDQDRIIVENEQYRMYYEDLPGYASAYFKEKMNNILFFNSDKEIVISVEFSPVTTYATEYVDCKAKYHFFSAILDNCKVDYLIDNYCAKDFNGFIKVPLQFDFDGHMNYIYDSNNLLIEEISFSHILYLNSITYYEYYPSGKLLKDSIIKCHYKVNGYEFIF